MESHDDAVREAAFKDLQKALPEDREFFFKLQTDEARRMRGAVIQLSITETKAIRTRKAEAEAAAAAAVKAMPAVSTTSEGSEAEGDGEEGDDEDPYLNDLIAMVASFDDERAIPALAGWTTIGGGAQEGLLKYGDKALGPVLAELKNPDPDGRGSALTMALLLLEKDPGPAKQAQMKDIILVSLHDSDPNVRRGALWHVQCLDWRADFIPEIEQIAKSDPEKLPGTVLDGGDNNQFFPERYTARQILRKIRNHEDISKDPMCEKRSGKQF
jgi:hypothetical protein